VGCYCTVQLYVIAVAVGVIIVQNTIYLMLWSHSCCSQKEHIGGQHDVPQVSSSVGSRAFSLRVCKLGTNLPHLFIKWTVLQHFKPCLYFFTTAYLHCMLISVLLTEKYIHLVSITVQSRKFIYHNQNELLPEVSAQPVSLNTVSQHSPTM